MNVKTKSPQAKAILLLLACCMAVPAHTSTGESSPTLAQLQQAAVQRNPELAVQRAAQEVAGAEVDIAKREWLPSVSANIDKSYGRGSGSFSDTRVSNRRVNDAGKVGFSVSQSLYNPILNINIEQANLNAQSTDFAIDQTYDELTNRIVSLFLDILATQSEMVLLEGQQVAVNEQRKQAQLSFEVGTVSITDVREAEAKHDRIAAQLFALKWQMQAKQAELTTLSGAKIEPSAYASSIQALPDVAEEDLTLWLAAMGSQNSLLKQSVIDYQIATLEKNKLQYKHYPKVQLVVENNRNLGAWSSEGQEDYTNSKWDWSAGVQVQFGLFNTNTSNAQTTKVLATQNQRFETIRASQERLNIEMQQTFYQILASIAEYQGLNKASESAETALLANMLGYQVGMRINADVLDAQSKIYEVNRDRLVAWSNSWRNYIKLNQLAGTLTVDQLTQMDDILRQTVENSSELEKINE
ncbi:TolC family protein [Psychrobacter sp. APC 3279]|uniref:TolC family protein n=1 Tax=Psychrobacter sp. APC 3279 TaxID=3035189 RepID=UPI0025B4B809|nr:TolC family protein [Psychrobacter sp. APC 3279]MDN3440012.1 TolC family protein [Psychrobacter sp. APC 3279]